MASSLISQIAASSGYGLLQVGAPLVEGEDTGPVAIDEEGGHLAQEPEGPPAMFIKKWQDLVIQPVFMPSTLIPRKVKFRSQMISPTGYHFGRNGAPFHEWTPAQTVGESTADTEWDYTSSSDPPADKPEIQEDRWKRAAYMRFGFTDRRDMATNAGRDAEPPTPDSGGSLPPNRECKETDLADDPLWAFFKQNNIPMYFLGRDYDMKAENINSAAFRRRTEGGPPPPRVSGI